MIPSATVKPSQHRRQHRRFSGPCYIITIPITITSVGKHPLFDVQPPSWAKKVKVKERIIKQPKHHDRHGSWGLGGASVFCSLAPSQLCGSE